MSTSRFKLWFVSPSLCLLISMLVGSALVYAQQQPASSKVPESRDAAAAIKIGSGDLLQITVFDVPEMNQEIRVGADGKAQLALVGPVTVAGLTAPEAADAIARELRNRQLLRQPQVNVLVQEFATQGVSVLGEVQHPGIYQVLGARSLLDVISMAGGLTNVADTRITVKRRGATDQKITARLKTDDADASLSGNVQVYPGDLVVVPRAGIVYVLGEVNRPGGFVMQDSGRITVLQALAQAGGANKGASLSKAVLLRRNSQGYAPTKLHADKIQRGEQADPELEANDILYVPSNRLKNVLNGTQSVASSIGSASIYAIVH